MPMTDLDPMTPEQYRANLPRIVALLRKTAALNLDENPPEMKSIITDARRLLSEAGLGVELP